MTQTARPLSLFVPLSETPAHLGESPVWSEAHGGYWWVDITGCRLRCTTLDGATQSWATPERPGFVQCISGTVFMGMETGIFVFDPARGHFHRRSALEVTGVRFNDACSDLQGRIWAGTMDLDNLRDCGVLYCFDTATGSLTALDHGFRTINGLAWDEARTRLYVSDSHHSVQMVWTAALRDDGTLGPRQPFADFRNLEGRPDGAALDAQGNYWIAGVGGGHLYRFTPDGEITARIRVPVASPTKPAFGPGGEMVLTSFLDNDLGGRLLVARPADGMT